MLLVMKKELQNNRLTLISLFLALEVMLFVALDFGGIGIVYKSLALILVLILTPYFWKEMKLDLSRGLYVLLMPIILYGFITLIAPAYGTMDVVYANETFMNLSMLYRLLNVFGLVAIMLIGYFLRKSAVFLPKHVYVVVLGGLALPILISLFATLINYGFFHTIVYKGYVNFYEGVAYPVATQASYLSGFKIMTVDINVLRGGAIGLASVGLGLIFLKKESDRFELIALGIISGVGLLTLILTGSFLTLIFLLPAIIFALIVRFNVMRFLKNRITLYIVIAIIVLGLVIFVFTAFNIMNLQTIWQSNPITRKLLFNGYMQRFYFVFREAITFVNLVGDFRNSVLGFKVFPTGSFLFDVMWIDGLLGFLMVAIFLGIFIYHLYVNFNKGSQDKTLKVAVISILLTLFFWFNLYYPFNQYVFEEFKDVNYFPLITSPYFLVALFLAGYIFNVENPDEVKEEVTNEEK